MKAAALFLCALLSCPGAWAQTANPRPKIGIALQGGGAKGLAHIGVLQWFEDHHIPIDFIAGTSMGGLVAGLYATGHSPAQIQQIVSKVDWGQVMSGAIPYPDLAFRRKLRFHANGFDNRTFWNFYVGFKLFLTALLLLAAAFAWQIAQLSPEVLAICVSVPGCLCQLCFCCLSELALFLSPPPSVLNRHLGLPYTGRMVFTSE